MVMIETSLTCGWSFEPLDLVISALARAMSSQCLLSRAHELDYYSYKPIHPGLGILHLGRRRKGLL